MLESLSPIDVALIKKIDGNGSSYTLPIASETTLGGVKPVAKTAEMTQSVGVDDAGGLWAAEASGGGSGGGFQKVLDFTTEEAVTQFSTPTLTQEQADAIASASVLQIVLYIPRDTEDTETSTTGTVNIYLYHGWDDTIIDKFTAIPKPTETYTKYGNWMFLVFKQPKSISYVVDNAYTSLMIAYGRFNSSNFVAPSVKGSGDSYRAVSETSYFKVSGSQTMAAGTRFIVEVLAS